MNDEKIIKKQLVKNMLLNLIAFTIIFSIFGIIIYGQVSNSLYKSADEELLNIKNKSGIVRNYQKQEIISRPKEESIKAEKPINPEINPRLIYVVRDENGTIINNENTGRIYEYINELNFNKSNLDEIYEINLSDSYQYRGINYKIEQNGEEKYIQILINVDAEKAIIENFTTTLVISIIVVVILSIIASYTLSRYTLKPIIQSWKKQVEFVQNASHELRTPLTIIQAKQELLLEKPESTILDNAEEITISLNETRRLSKLIKDLMILARADSENETLNKEKINIDECIKQVCLPYTDLANLQGKELNLNLKYNKEIQADRSKIQQLLVIILDNSIKYTEEKDKIEINTEEKDNKCIIEIKDTGIGISDEGIKHIFDRFYREDKARSRQTGGSGLGLSIANSIVKLHNGTIKAEHNIPKGTIVTIKIPI